VHLESAAPRRLLLTDIDGTLLDDDGELPARNREALTACRNAEVTVALATGRRWTTTRRLLDRLALWDAVDFAILNNGMVIRDLHRGESIASHGFALELTRDIADGLASLHMDPVLLSHGEESQAADVHYRKVSLLNQDFIDKNPTHARAYSRIDELQDLDIVEILLVGRYDDLRQAQSWLAALPVETALIKNSFYREWMLEVTPKGISKHSGALFLQKHVGAQPGTSMAIGDSANDLPLLRAAQHAVAMQHAPDEVKQAATAMAGPNHAGGMGDAVLAWLRGFEQSFPGQG
jgi:Cof subfamily protein (haloacid dehalogenase superfamily)